MEKDPNKQEEQELDEKKLEQQLKEASTPEEMFEVIQEFTKNIKQNPDDMKKIQARQRKKQIIYYAIVFVISLAIMLGLTGLFQPFILKMRYGDLFFIATIALIQLIIMIVVSFFRNHVIIALLSEAIIDVLVALSIVLVTAFVPFVKFTSEWEGLIFVVVYLSTKSILSTTIKKHLL